MLILNLFQCVFIWEIAIKRRFMYFLFGSIIRKQYFCGVFMLYSIIIQHKTMYAVKCISLFDFLQSVAEYIRSIARQ